MPSLDNDEHIVKLEEEESAYCITSEKLLLEFKDLVDGILTYLKDYYCNSVCWEIGVVRFTCSLINSSSSFSFSSSSISDPWCLFFKCFTS